MPATGPKTGHLRGDSRGAGSGTSLATFAQGESAAERRCSVHRFFQHDTLFKNKKDISGAVAMGDKNILAKLNADGISKS